jgi:nicotinamidase-related amidase
MRIEKDSSIAVLVDVQERLFPVISNNAELEKNLNILVDGLHVLGVPVLVSEQYTKGLGKTIASVAEKVAHHDHVEKMAFSCCDEPRFAEKLELSKKRTVLLAGIETHVCVLQTAIDLIERGFIPVVIEDCVSSRNPENKRIAIERMRREGAVITSCESLLFELCRVSGTDAFKAISKLVK